MDRILISPPLSLAALPFVGRALLHNLSARLSLGSLGDAPLRLCVAAVCGRSAWPHAITRWTHLPRICRPKALGRRPRSDVVMESHGFSVRCSGAFFGDRDPASLEPRSNLGLGLQFGPRETFPRTRASRSTFCLRRPPAGMAPCLYLGIVASVSSGRARALASALAHERGTPCATPVANPTLPRCPTFLLRPFDDEPRSEAWMAWYRFLSPSLSI